MRFKTFVPVAIATCALALACAGCQGAGATSREPGEPAESGSGNFEDDATFDGQRNISLGDSFEGDGFSAKLTGIEVLDEVQPANPNGYYLYMEKQDGMKYVVVNGEVTNTSSETVSVGNGTTISISNPALLYTGDATQLSGGVIWAAPADGSTLGSTELEPGASTPFKIIFSVDEDLAADLSGYKVFFTVDDGFDSASFSTLGSDEVAKDAGGEYVYCLEL